jgi:DNA-directed RNA polymerase specialized sigma24 family protein
MLRVVCGGRGVAMTDQGSITRWIGELREGEQAAAEKLWEVYFQRLLRLARGRLESAPRRAADEEDVALSAFHSFCRGARQGRFPRLADRHALWPLLVAITSHKCVDLRRREGRRPAAELPAAEVLLSESPSPDFEARVAEELDRLLSLLDATGDPDLRPIALGRMQGESAAEMAARMGCVRRTVERKLGIVARVWEREAGR